MKKLQLLFCAASALLAFPVFAQDDAPGENRPPNGPNGPMMPPVLKALDVNGDGIISAEEIANAPAALKLLDKNKDGKLDQSELRPNFGGMGRGGPMPGGPDMGGPGGMRGNAMSAEDQVKRYLTLDKNGDGKLSKDEVPERMQSLFTRADADKDGVITKAELEAMVKKSAAAAQNRGGPGGGGPPPGDFPGN